jgi:uncharacterized membrane protein YgdD (TMEM256/DUF423 family)
MTVGIRRFKTADAMQKAGRQLPAFLRDLFIRGIILFSGFFYVLYLDRQHQK